MQSSYEGVHHLQTAFKGRIASYVLPATNQTVDYLHFFDGMRKKVLTLIEDSIMKHKVLKVNLEVFGNYHLKSSGEFTIKSFNTKNQIVTVATDLGDVFDSMKERLITKAQEFNENKSGQ